jgi:lactoylglutathione lyase
MSGIAAISIYVDDLPAAIDFYTKQLGFKVGARPAPVIVELEDEGLWLALCQAERKSTQDYPAGAGTVIGLAWTNLEKTATAMKNDGVNVVIDSPQEFPGGRFIAVRDPAGNVIELLEFAR